MLGFASVRLAGVSEVLRLEPHVLRTRERAMHGSSLLWPCRECKAREPPTKQLHRVWETSETTPPLPVPKLQDQTSAGSLHPRNSESLAILAPRSIKTPQPHIIGVKCHHRKCRINAPLHLLLRLCSFGLVGKRARNSGFRRGLRLSHANKAGKAPSGI